MTQRPAALRLLSGGAAKGLVDTVRDAFARMSGCTIDGTFGAVGAMQERLLAGESFDVAILTAAMVDALTKGGHLISGSAQPLGRVATGLAVRTGDPVPDIAEPASVASVLRSADAIYLPDPLRSTAGVHVAGVLQQLGIDPGTRLRPYPHGAAAMAALAKAPDAHPIGATQVTEILYTAGVTLVGPFPPPLELVTVYVAAVCRAAADPARAHALVEWVGGLASAAARTATGFN